jgi:hypothetical protein
LRLLMRPALHVRDSIVHDFAPMLRVQQFVKNQAADSPSGLEITTT